ncbi:MAG: sugar transferase [Patescibacteria group bacterium]|nr:sugar transferase [Patescibacteria group bacterium]
MTNSSLTGNKKIFLIFGDIIILYFSLWLTLLIRYWPKFNYGVWNQHLIPFSIIFLTWLIIFYIDDLYELTFGQGLVSLINKLIRGTIINGLIAIVFFYFTADRFFTIKPQRVLLIYLAIAIILILIWRLIFNSIVRSRKRANGVILVGFNRLAEEIIKTIESTPQLGLQIKSIISTDQAEIPQPFKHYLEARGYAELKNICLDHKTNIIVSTINPRDNQALLKSLFECIPLKIDFFDITNFYEKITGKIPVTIIEQIWFLENLTENNKNLYEKIKKICDILFALLMFIILLPFIPIISLAIKLSSHGPVFFTQTRTGKNSKKFKVIKFRTMIIDAEKFGPQWASENDSRITKLGKFLRKTRIDEIPQLINVIKGEMSLVGPRPERPEFVDQLSSQIPFYNERLLIKPGLTGWAQVVGPSYGGSKDETLEKLQYDLFYIKNRSLGLDISILLKTIRIVLSQKGQ